MNPFRIFQTNSLSVHSSIICEGDMANGFNVVVVQIKRHWIQTEQNVVELLTMDMILYHNYV